MRSNSTATKEAETPAAAFAIYAQVCCVQIAAAIVLAAEDAAKREVPELSRKLYLEERSCHVLNTRHIGSA